MRVSFPYCDDFITDVCMIHGTFYFDFAEKMLKVLCDHPGVVHECHAPSGMPCRL